MEDDKEEVDHISRWKDETDLAIAIAKAQQDFVNDLIQKLHDADPFRGAPDEQDLYRTAEMAIRLAHTCYKQGGRGPVRGYGIRMKYIEAARKGRRP